MSNDDNRNSGHVNPSDRSLGEYVEGLRARLAGVQIPPILVDRQHIYLTDVPKYAPPGPNGHKMHISTPRRWHSQGIRGVKLEAFRWGSRWVTSIEALARFIAATSLEQIERSSPPQTPKQRQKGIEQVDRDLNRERI